MTQVNGEKLMNEMNGFLNDAAKENSESEIALPFEAFEDYSTDPVSFNNQSKLMLQKVHRPLTWPSNITAVPPNI